MIVWEEKIRKLMGMTRKTFQGDHFRVSLGTGHALTSMIKTPNGANSEANNRTILLITFRQ